MSIKVMIVDDEPLAREGLRLRLESMPDIDIIAECSGGNHAIQELRQQSVDLVFLDIKMPKVNGFDVVAAIGVDNMPLVIFLTAYDQFAIEAFEVNATDYLLKPVSQDRLEAAIQRARRSLESQQLQQQSQQLTRLMQQVAQPSAPCERLVVKSHGQIHFIAAEEILWLEADGDYVNIHTDKRAHLQRETLANLEKRLANQGFQRVHRSAIVRLNAIEKLLCNDNGDYQAQLKNGELVKVSRGYKDKLFACLTQ